MTEPAHGSRDPFQDLLEKGRCLVVSTLDSSGGRDDVGLLAVVGERVHRLTTEGATGLHEDGGKLAALSWAEREHGHAWLRLYDEDGLTQVTRLKGVLEPHDVLLADESLVVVSTSTNEVLWFSASGECLRRWHAPGEGDAWHLNSLYLHEGRLLVTAFGRYAEDRAWNLRAGRNEGVVFDLETGQDVLKDLERPHNPRHLKGVWYSNESASGRVRALGAEGDVWHSVALDGWTRGLALTEEHVFCGVSRRRRDGQSQAARVVALDAETLAVKGAVPLGAAEVYDVVITSAKLAAAVQASSAGAPGQLPTVSMGQTHPHQPGRASVEIEAPAVTLLGAASSVLLHCTLRNTGSHPLESRLPNPTFASYRWTDVAGRPPQGVGESVRTPLPGSLAPGATCSIGLRVITPPPGEYYLIPTAVEEGVAWYRAADDEGSDRVMRVTVV